jgi:hypothetical protein
MIDFSLLSVIITQNVVLILETVSIAKLDAVIVGTHDR